MENIIPTKILSFFLSVLLLFYAIPSVILVEAADAVKSGESDSVDAPFPEDAVHTDEPDPTESAKGQLSTITTDSTTYTFTYDLFSNADATSIGDSTLATYTYILRGKHYGTDIDIRS